MVEGAPLLREYTRNGIVGSNPIFSAIFPKYRALIVVSPANDIIDLPDWSAMSAIPVYAGAASPVGYGAFLDSTADM